MNNIVKQVLLIAAIFTVVGVIGVTWARATSYIATGADVPDDMICVRDTFPDAYFCSYDHSPSWLKTKENYHD